MSVDKEFMDEAIKLAIRSYEEDEVPVGAVVVKDNKIIGCGYNQKDKTKNPLKHAELIAIEEACKYMGDWRLNDCTLYTTFEPCMMCMGAIVESRISKVVYGIKKDEQMFCNLNDIEIVGGVLEEECLHLLQKFFKNKRNNTKNVL